MTLSNVLPASIILVCLSIFPTTKIFVFHLCIFVLYFFPKVLSISSNTSVRSFLFSAINSISSAKQSTYPPVLHALSLLDLLQNFPSNVLQLHPVPFLHIQIKELGNGRQSWLTPSIIFTFLDRTGVGLSSNCKQREHALVPANRCLAYLIYDWH